MAIVTASGTTQVTTQTLANSNILQNSFIVLNMTSFNSTTTPRHGFLYYCIPSGSPARFFIVQRYLITGQGILIPVTPALTLNVSQFTLIAAWNEPGNPWSLTFQTP